MTGLEKGKAYTALFWADYDAPSATLPTYDITYLNWVKLNGEDVDNGDETTSWVYKPVAMAYCGRLDFTYGEASSYNVTLKRAVAAINLVQTEATTALDETFVATKYKARTIYDVNVLAPADDATYNPEVDNYVEFPLTAGAIAANTVLGTTYVLAPAEEAVLTNIDLYYNWTKIGTVASAPVQANYQTNVKGVYVGTPTEFVVTTDDIWNTGNESEMGEPSAKEPIVDPADPADADYITLGGVKWAKAPVATTWAAIETNTPSGFSVPAWDQLQKLIDLSTKYFGTYQGTNGILFSKAAIEGATAATVASDASVTGGDYTAIAFTDEQVGNGLFLPVNVGGEGYYWGQMSSGYYTFLYFSDSWMKVNWTAEADAEWLLQQTCGLIAVK